MTKVTLNWEAVFDAMTSAFEEFYLDTESGRITRPDPETDKDGPGPGEVVVPRLPPSVEYFWMMEFADHIGRPDRRRDLFRALGDPKKGMDRFRVVVTEDPYLESLWRDFRRVRAFEHVSSWIEELGIDADLEPARPELPGMDGEEESVLPEDAMLERVLLILDRLDRPPGFKDFCARVSGEVGWPGDKAEEAAKKAVAQGWLTLTPGLGSQGTVVVFTRQGERRLVEAKLDLLARTLEAASRDPGLIHRFLDTTRSAGEDTLCRFLDDLSQDDASRYRLVLTEMESRPGTRIEAALRRALARADGDSRG